MSARYVVVESGAFRATVYTEKPEGASWRYDKTVPEKILKGLQYLGPWCPNCGKKGDTCTGRKVAACEKRQRAALVRRLSRPEHFPAGCLDWRRREYRQNILAKWADMTFGGAA